MKDVIGGFIGAEEVTGMGDGIALAIVRDSI